MSVKKDQVTIKEAVEREGRLLRTISGSFSGSFRSRSRSRSFSTGRWRRRRNASVSVSIQVNNRRRHRSFRTGST